MTGPALFIIKRSLEVNRVKQGLTRSKKLEVSEVPAYCKHPPLCENALLKAKAHKLTSSYDASM